MCVRACGCFHCVRFRRVKEMDRVGVGVGVAWVGELKRAIGLSFNVAITICQNRRVCLSVCVRASARLPACLHVCTCVYTHNPVRIVCVGVSTHVTHSLTHSLTRQHGHAHVHTHTCSTHTWPTRFLGGCLLL